MSEYPKLNLNLSNKIKTVDLIQIQSHVNPSPRTPPNSLPRNARHQVNCHRRVDVWTADRQPVLLVLFVQNMEPAPRVAIVQRKQLIHGQGKPHPLLHHHRMHPDYGYPVILQLRRVRNSHVHWSRCLEHLPRVFLHSG